MLPFSYDLFFKTNSVHFFQKFTWDAAILVSEKNNYPIHYAIFIKVIENEDFLTWHKAIPVFSYSNLRIISSE